MNTAYLHLFASILLICLSLPLILGVVKMNRFYGVRIPEAFRSEKRWYQINRFGGILMLIWGVVLCITATIGMMLDQSQWSKYNLVAIGVALGGAAVVTIAIFAYAAATKND